MAIEKYLDGTMRYVCDIHGYRSGTTLPLPCPHPSCLKQPDYRVLELRGMRYVQDDPPIDELTFGGARIFIPLKKRVSGVGGSSSWVYVWTEKSKDGQ